uniref:Uncharacterized protein n=1 Tax=Ralstonia solanacearum TaxID=305 RepID=A0A0S4U9S2_RALSL|nr:protein of unknown function [Ralstonia solanacearum]
MLTVIAAALAGLRRCVSVMRSKACPGAPSLWSSMAWQAGQRVIPHSVQWVGHCITLVYGKKSPPLESLCQQGCTQPTRGPEAPDVHPIAVSRCLLTRPQHTCKRTLQDFQAVTSKY